MLDKSGRNEHPWEWLKLCIHHRGTDLIPGHRTKILHAGGQSKEEYPFDLFFSLGRKVFSLSTLNMILLDSFLYRCSLFKMRMSPIFLVCLVFSSQIGNRFCQMLVCISWYHCVFFLLWPIDMVAILIGFWILNQFTYVLNYFQQCYHCQCRDLKYFYLIYFFAFGVFVWNGVL